MAMKVMNLQTLVTQCYDNADTHITILPVTLNNASDYRANGLLSDYIRWTNGLTD